MLDSSGAISAAQLAFFAVATPPLLYVLIKHGTKGVLGWLPLFAFCTLRIVGGALTIATQTSGTTNTAAPVISQVAISPLLFAICGVVHEASTTVVKNRKFVLGWATQIILHLMVAVALALIVVGATSYTSPGKTPDEMNNSLELVRGGAAILLVILIFLSVVVFISYTQPRVVKSEKQLIVAVVGCMPFLALRVLYTFLGAMINSSSWSFLSGGTLAEEVILATLPEFLITMILVAAGVMTRRLPHDRNSAPSLRMELPSRRSAKQANTPLGEVV